MKKGTRRNDKMRNHYDFTGGVRGKYAHRYAEGTNAGIMPVSPLDDLRVKDWEEMIDINIKGVLYGIAAALPIFRKQGFGHFVNIASTAGHKTVPNQSAIPARSSPCAPSPRVCARRPVIAARDDHFAWLRPDELHRRCDKSGGESPTLRVPRQVRDAARYCVRDRAAGRC